MEWIKSNVGSYCRHIGNLLRRLVSAGCKSLTGGWRAGDSQRSRDGRVSYPDGGETGEVHKEHSGRRVAGRDEEPRLMFSQRSLKALEGVDGRLRAILDEAIRVYDFTVLEGVRSREKQAEMVEKGASKTMESKHLDGLAVDIAPHPIDWEDIKRFTYLAGIVVGIAHSMDIPIRWGGNWDRDNEILSDQKFDDCPHF